MNRTTDRQRTWTMRLRCEVVLLAVLTVGLGPAAFAQPPAARDRQGTDNTSGPGPRSPFDLTQGRKQKSFLPEMTHIPSDVRDDAGMFSSEAVRRAREALETMEKSTGV